MRSEIEFDADGLVARVARASVEILRRMGAYVRTVARRKVRPGERPSPAGTPPHSRTGALKRGILFGVERRQASVVIGPSERFVGTSMAAHEFGGAYKRERYPKRPLMGPALKESTPRLARMFHGTAGSKATTEMSNVTDVTLNLETGEADITTRAAEGWRITAATLKEASVEFEMIWDTADSGFTAIQQAYFNNSALSLFVSDGDGNGLDADFVVTSFSRSEPLEEALKVSVTCKPTLVSRAPAWVGGGH